MKLFYFINYDELSSFELISNKICSILYLRASLTFSLFTMFSEFLQFGYLKNSTPLRNQILFLDNLYFHNDKIPKILHIPSVSEVYPKSFFLIFDKIFCLILFLLSINTQNQPFFSSLTLMPVIKALPNMSYKYLPYYINPHTCSTRYLFVCSIFSIQ